MTTQHSEAALQEPDDTSLVSSADAFEIFPELLKQLPADGFDLSRGDPVEAPSALQLEVIAILNDFSIFATRRAKQLGQAAANELPLAELDRAWQRALEGIGRTRQARQGATRVRREVYAALRRRGTPRAEALLEALRLMASELAGGRYGRPAGQEHLRAVAARQILGRLAATPGQPGPHIDGGCVVFTDGASEAIGALFRLLAAVGYLQPGDRIALPEPVYTPYLSIAHHLGLRVVTIPSRPENGWAPALSDLDAFAAKLATSSQPLKVLALVNPSNPSACAWSQAAIERLAQILWQYGTLAVEDVVYHEFLPRGRFHSLWAYLPTQTVLIYSLSKYHRVTGSRLGMAVITDAADAFISEHVIGRHRLGRSPYGKLAASKSVREQLALAKGPGPLGELNHTCHVPKRAQWEAVVRMLVDRASGRREARALDARWTTFYHRLGLPTPQETDHGSAAGWVPYYALIDLCALVARRAEHDAGSRALLQAMQSRALDPWQVFQQIAQAGVALMPAARFFADPSAHRWLFRASVANQSHRNVARAADRIAAYLQALAARYAASGSHLSA